MKILFCDLCNESVPQGDLEAGKAVMRMGRVICGACEAAMSASAPPASTGASIPAGAPAAQAGTAPARPAPPSGSSAAPGAIVGIGLAFSAVALIVAAGSAAFLFLRFDERQGELEVRARAQEALEAERDARARRAEAEISELRSAGEKEIAAARAEIAGLSGQLARLEREHAGASDALGASLTRLEGRLDDLEDLRESCEKQGLEIAAAAETTSSLRAELARLAEQVGADAARARATEAGALERPLAPAGPKETSGAAWLPWVSDLASPNSGTRWQAVQSLGGTGDPAVAPHLAPMLEDSDIFVRMAAARVLGDLHAVEAIPALIDALEDEEASVREASFVSLRAISGQAIAFDPLAKEAERAKRVKAWRDWWEQASKELLGGKGKPKG